MESEDEGSSSDGGSSGQGSAEGQQQQQRQQQGALGPAAAEPTEGSQQNGSERGSGEAAAAAAAAASGESEPGGSTPGGRDSGDGGESAAAGGQGDEDDAEEVAALLREENLEALADEEREKLTQVRGGSGTDEGAGCCGGGAGCWLQPQFGFLSRPGQLIDCTGSSCMLPPGQVAVLLRRMGHHTLTWRHAFAPLQLDQLTGQPRADDILLYAVPVCAPYQVSRQLMLGS